MRRNLKDKVLRLRIDHPEMTVSEIARQIDAVPQYVSATLKRNGLSQPRPSTKSDASVGVAAFISPHVCKMLMPEAERRDVSIKHLVRLIVEVVARDGIVTAILDDTPEEVAA